MRRRDEEYVQTGMTEKVEILIPKEGATGSIFTDHSLHLSAPLPESPTPPVGTMRVDLPFVMVCRWCRHMTGEGESFPRYCPSERAASWEDDWGPEGAGLRRHELFRTYFDEPVVEPPLLNCVATIREYGSVDVARCALLDGHEGYHQDTSTSLTW